jgi:hypothetical protein
MARNAAATPSKTRAGRRPPARASSRGPNWGRLVAEGRAARSSADAGRWRIGHLASLVAKQYGSRSLQAFADDIGETYSTVRRYRWVFTRYEPTVRFGYQQLSFSHFQAVAGLPDRTKWLGRADSGCWSVDELVRQSRIGSPSAPSKSSARAAALDLRAPIRQARTHLKGLAHLDDADLRKAATWLEPLLDDLAADIDRLRGRITEIRGLRVVRYRTGANGHRHGNGNGHRTNGNGHGTNGNGRRAKARP